MTVRSVVVRLSAETSGLVAGYRKAEQESERLHRSLTGQESARRKAIGDLGDTAGKVGLVAAAGLGLAVKSAADFEQGMSNVKAATHASAGTMDQYRSAALKAGADTAFSATESAAAIENLAKAGLSSADILGGGLTGALDLAAAGGLDVASAAEIAATALTQFNLSGSDMGHVADLLAAGAGKAQGEVTDLAQALNQSGLVAAQMGLSIEETTGTLAAFASAGLLGSDAGTSLKTMLLRLANPSKEAAELMQQLGINAYDANGNLVSMSDLAGQLQGAFKGQSQAQRDAALATIFGSDAIRAANVLYSQGERGINGWTRKVDDSGYAAETAAAKLDNLKGDLEALGGSLETALIGTGSGAQGPLRSLVQELTDLVNAYNKLPQAAQSSVAGVLAATALLGGGAFLAAKTITGIAATRSALADLGVQAGTTRGALRGLATGLGIFAGVAALGQLDAFIDQLRDADLEIDNLGRSLSALGRGDVTGTLEETFGGSLDGFADSIDRLNSRGEKLAEFSAQMIGIGKVIDTPMEEATANVDALDQALAAMVEGGRTKDARAAFGELTSAAAEQGIALSDVSRHFDQYQTALANARGEGGSVAGIFGSAVDSIRDSIPAMNGSTGATRRNTGALRDNAEAMREIRSLRLAAMSAEIGYEQAVDDARAALRANGRTLDITTQKGRDNKTALLNMAAAWNEQSRAAKAAPGAHRAAIGSFVRMATQMGMSREAAERLAKKILEVPQRRTSKFNAETGQASANVRGLQSDINGLRDRTITITTVRRTITRASRNIGNIPEQLFGEARGGVLDFYAAGGMRTESHVAQIAPAGAWRVWAEPETGGEAYIPLAADSRRPGAQDVWRETGKRIGMQWQEFAEGGLTGRFRASTGVPGGGRVTAVLEGPVEVRGNFDPMTGKLVGVMERVAGRVVDSYAVVQGENARRSYQYGGTR